jgi:ribosome maturation factor RimP
VEDVIPGGSYTLEVSSPGLDRKLTKAADFARFVGSRMKLMTRQPVNNNRHFEGRLERFENDRLTLDLSVASHKSRKKMGADAGRKIEIEFANVEKANLVPEI